MVVLWSWRCPMSLLHLVMMTLTFDCDFFLKIEILKQLFQSILHEMTYLHSRFEIYVIYFLRYMYDYKKNSIQDDHLSVPQESYYILIFQFLYYSICGFLCFLYIFLQVFASDIKVNIDLQKKIWHCFI